MKRLLFLLALASVFVSCESQLNDQNILGSWKVQKAKYMPINPNITASAVQRTENKLASSRYTFLEDGALTVTRGDGEVHKGGTWMLDMERNILTLQENYRDMMLPSVLWTIKESTPATMTLTSTEPNKANIRIEIKKVGS